MHRSCVIVDYGMGNLWSVAAALRFLGVTSHISNCPELVVEAEVILLPGVGSFRNAMNELKKRSLDVALREAVIARKHKILGICLGMQLFAEYGTEDGETEGLGLIKGRVERFSREDTGSLKVPHIGFNQVKNVRDSKLFSGLNEPTDFYFAHSFRLKPNQVSSTVATAHYGIDFVAALEQDNIYATQFHPEKSQTNGLRLLRNFLLA